MPHVKYLACVFNEQVIFLQLDNSGYNEWYYVLSRAVCKLFKIIIIKNAKVWNEGGHDDRIFMYRCNASELRDEGGLNPSAED